MRRIAAGFALACLSVFAVQAKEKAKDRPPIEDTYIIAPKQSAAYTLTRAENYSQQGGKLLDGVGLTFRDALSPALNTDIFIYPVGGDATLDSLEASFRAGVKYAEERGMYTITQWGDAQPYQLRRPDGSEWDGRIVPLRMKLKTTEVQSRAYLFHRGTYAYKVRIDLPLDQATDLQAAADALVRAVLPSIQVVSVGGCGRDMTINILQKGEAMPADLVDGVSPDGFYVAMPEEELESKDVVADMKAGKGLVGRMLVANQHQVAYGCTSSDYTPPADSDEQAVLKLHYPAEFWKTGKTAH